VDGSCRPSDTLCHFDYQCGPGQNCVDGRCLTTCNATTGAGCGTGLVCIDGFCQPQPNPNPACDCTPNQVCVSNACLAVCNADTDCPSGNFCDHGACRIDDRRPPPQCDAGHPCAAGSVCLDGACHVSCPTGTSLECQQHDVVFNQCDTMHVCRSSSEIHPQCARNSDCVTSGLGTICVNALCRN
jgi:hypothetical protein